MLTIQPTCVHADDSTNLCACMCRNQCLSHLNLKIKNNINIYIQANPDVTCQVDCASTSGWQVWTAVNDQALAPLWFSAFIMLLPGDNTICAADTNGLADYYLRPHAGAVLYNQIPILRAPSVYTSTTILQSEADGGGSGGRTKLRIGALVANLAHDKQVTAVLSSDGWKSVTYAPLQYQPQHVVAYDGVAESPNQNQVEYWECALSFLSFIGRQPRSSATSTMAQDDLRRLADQHQVGGGYCGTPMPAVQAAGNSSVAANFVSFAAAAAEERVDLSECVAEGQSDVVEVEFALRYRVLGAEFWDNNWGANHRLRLHVSSGHASGSSVAVAY
jgi:hypothetical protein